MRKIWNKIFLICGLSLSVFQIQAQRAEAGPAGVWLLMDISNGVKNSYAIWRKDNRSDWTKVGKLLPPKSEAELDARLFDLEALNLDMPARLNEKQVKRLWRVIQKNAPKDSFIPYYNNYPVLYAAGLAWYDSEAKLGDYNYKIDRLDGNGRNLESKETDRVKVPGSGPEVLFILKDMKNVGNVNTLNYEISMAKDMVSVHVFRSYYQRTGYEKINPDIFFTKTDKGYNMTISDFTAASLVPYTYYMVPFDAAGNPGNKSVEVKMYSVAENTIPPSVTKFKAYSENAKKAVRLAWKLSDASRVVSIDIYKGMVYDGKYFKVASVKPHDTDYFDYQVLPVSTYYYTIVLNGMYETSPTSPRVSGMLEGVNSNYLAPQQLQVSVDNNFSTLTWSRTETDTRGYFLWRGIGSVSDLKKMKQILSDSANNTYIDTVPGILEDTRIFYALSDVNTSYNESPVSEVVTCVVRGDESFPPPDSISLYAVNEKTIRLIWKPMGLKFGRVYGYNVYRYYTNDSGKEAEGSLKKLNSVPLGYEMNQFVDSTCTGGKRWVYFVRSVGESIDALSKKSPEVNHVTKEFFEFANVSQVNAYPQAGGVKLTWNNPVGEKITSVEVWRAETNKEPKLIKKLDAKSEGFTDSEIKSGTAVFYYIRCGYASNFSEFTEAVGVTVP